MRQSGFDPRIEIGAQECPGKRYQSQIFPAAKLGIDRSRTGASNSPANSEKGAADDRTFLVWLAFEVYWITEQSFLTRHFDKCDRYRTDHHSGTHNQIHVRFFEAEHILDSKPG